MGWYVSSKKANYSLQDVPEVRIKSRLKKIEIEGYSRMANPGDFYEDLILQLKDYYKSFNHTMILDFKFEYINTSSGKWLLVLFNSLDPLINEGLIEINWYYEEDDESILEAGEIYKSSSKMPFHLKKIVL